MVWRIIQGGDDKTIEFAAEELERHLRLIDPTCMADCILDGPDVERGGCIYVGLSRGDRRLPEVKDIRLDDAVLIDVTGTEGIITGTNERSVLMAVYRYLREQGVAFIRPGLQGTMLPDSLDTEKRIYVCEAASYRHRGICMEGVDAYEHLADLVDWMPKLMFNSYFVQFLVPTIFVERWYRHVNNPLMDAYPTTPGQIMGMLNKLHRQIAKRGIMLQYAGHGWTCEPFGIDSTVVVYKSDNLPYAPQEISEETHAFFSLVDGKRALWKDNPLKTNLCYSNPLVRGRIADAVCAYAKEHPQVGYIQFWLGDADNNHCECENCKDTPPSDYYVQMLNEIDEKLTAQGLDTRIVFILYIDLLWPPLRERLRNKERFTLMFAPISRSYTSSYDMEPYTKELPPYVRNRLTMPRSIGENLARLKQWQRLFDGDSFDFEYHFYWEHFKDPGCVAFARIVYEDMRALRDIGLNGNMSCQCQRVCFPVSFGMHVMAQTLWNRDIPFETLADGYFAACFGAYGRDVREYLSTVSASFPSGWMRGETPGRNAEYERTLSELPGKIREKLLWLDQRIAVAGSETLRRSFGYLRDHAALLLHMIPAFVAAARGEKARAHELAESGYTWACQNEYRLHGVFDVYEFMKIIPRVITRMKE